MGKECCTGSLHEKLHSLQWGKPSCQLGPSLRWWWLPGNNMPLSSETSRKESELVHLDYLLKRQKHTLDLPSEFPNHSPFTASSLPLSSPSICFPWSYAPASNTCSELSSSFFSSLCCILYNFSPICLLVYFVSFIVKPICWCFDFLKKLFILEDFKILQTYTYTNIDRRI